MSKYLTFFRIRFSTGLQYRTAALAGIMTQFFWGLMEVLLFTAFFEQDASAFPMKLKDVSSYIWLQQAFLALFMTWLLENDIFQAIQDGGISYELCRPIDLYNLWFVKNMANRLSKTVLRCVPILAVTAFLPKPYGISLPFSVFHFLCFLITMFFGFLVVIAFCMLIYITTFFTISPLGVRMVALSLVELLSGAVIPLPFFPDSLRKIVDFLPFASMQNVPLRVYSGDLQGEALYYAVGLQIFWIIILIGFGKWMLKKALKQVTLQGG